MTTYGPHSTLAEVLASPRARAALSAALPDPEGTVPSFANDVPLSAALLLGSVPNDVAIAVFAELGKITRPTAEHLPAVEADPKYEGHEIPLASAGMVVPAQGAVNELFEIELSGPRHGNPFLDVDLWAEFRSESGEVVRVGGFYDGEGRYLFRLLPGAPGRWEFAVTSTARSLDGVTGSFVVELGEARGPVGVSDTFGFGYANGDPYVPIGTTAYAWTHQSEELEEQTLETLRESAFNKLRMCVFPKAYEYNSNEPRWFPFPRRDDGEFDFSRFDPAYFEHLERRLKDLQALGIEADLILFHPYDRWGFADLGPSVDERYLSYVVRRLAAFPNVWWSMANEYDFVSSKDAADWHRLAAVVQSEDHVGHLLSIHNGILLFDFAAHWVTHCSIQRHDAMWQPVEGAAVLRARWRKPVVFDEVGYEGDLEMGWGHVPAFEVVRRFWQDVLDGAYVTHGETYWNEDEILFWSKGGRLAGESPARIAFLARIVAESPTGRLDPIKRRLMPARAGVADRYEVQYLGVSQPRSVNVLIPTGMKAYIDVIDTWNMTIDAVPGSHETSARVNLPAKPYMAIRLRALT